MIKDKDVTILLVEDDDIDAQAIKRSFKNQGIMKKMMRAKDGLDALEMLEKNLVPKPYIILLDLNMPRMNGIEFLEALRDHNELSDSIVYILTTSQDEQDILSAHSLKATGFFVKSQADEGFHELIKVNDGYWDIVHLPYK